MKVRGACVCYLADDDPDAHTPFPALHPFVESSFIPLLIRRSTLHYTRLPRPK